MPILWRLLLRNSDFYNLHIVFNDERMKVAHRFLYSDKNIEARGNMFESMYLS